jgi:hypothetical protein
MKNRPRRFSRLVDALDELVRQERSTLEAGEFGDVAAIQRRAAPIISELVDLGSDAADATARAHVAAVLSRRQHNIDFLESQLATTRAELLAIQTSEQRLARLAPAYARPEPGTLRRLNATG